MLDMDRTCSIVRILNILYWLIIIYMYIYIICIIIYVLVYYNIYYDIYDIYDIYLYIMLAA